MPTMGDCNEEHDPMEADFPDKLCNGLDMEDSSTLDLSSQNLTTIPGHVIENNQVTKLLIDYNDLTSLPETFGDNLLSLQFFSAIGNSFASLPCSFGKLGHLSDIYLNENGLHKLPDAFCCLKSLRKLTLTGNNMECLPEDFGELTLLEVLYCEENSLTLLPKTFGMLKNLKELELGCNSISDLPDDFGMLRSLQVLNLCDNKLDVLPESFGDLGNLRTLDVSCNNIKCLPLTCKSAHTLQKLYAESNRLHCLPDWISDMSQIKEFSAKDNQFQNQPLSDKFPLGCGTLKHLDLSGNFISWLPENLGCCTNLEFLHFGSVIEELERRNFQNGNWLAEIPGSMCQLEHLRELHLDENQISELPKDFGHLVSLEMLDLGQNLLHELPESFGDLKCLRVCMLSKNHIQWLPYTFGNLECLEDLRLDDNELGELPESFSRLKMLKTLDLFCNRLREIPEALHSLKNLVRLDLDANDFQVPLSEIPQIVMQTKYPERDPNLKNNWRGRPRQDMVTTDDDVIKVEGCDQFEFEPPPPSLNYSEDFLISAMERNLSIWKSHSQSSDRRPRKRRQLPKHRDYGNIDVGGEDLAEDLSGGEDVDEKNQSECSDDDFVPPLLVEAKQWSGLNISKPDSPPPSANNNNASYQIEETECWDDEVDSLPEYYDNVVPQYEIHPTKMYYPPVYNGQFTFAPHDIHVPDFVKCPSTYPVEDGQFENSETDETTEISVDPVF